MVLVDTSVWIDHFRQGEPQLSDLLEQGRVICHPMIIGELACGNLGNRAKVLHLISQLPHIEQVSNKEILRFVEEQRLMGRGIGYIDVHLVRACSKHDACTLWTRDKRLARVAEELGIGF